MSLALEAAPPFILLFPGILPLVFFAHYCLVCPPSLASTSLTICICVSFLGPLAALSASFGIVALSPSNTQSFLLAQNAVQCVVELGYRMAIVYLMVPGSTAIDISYVSLSTKGIYCHNLIIVFFIFTAFLLSILHLSIPAIPHSLSPALGFASALLSIPLLAHLALSTPSSRVRRFWSFVIILQLLSASAAILRVPASFGYAVPGAICTILWGGGVLVLFYALLVLPLSTPQPQPCIRNKFALLDRTPTRVHYHARTFSASTGVVTSRSEDFTALRDPFASPPPVPPLPRISPISPTFNARAWPLRPSTPTPIRKETRVDSPLITDEVFLSQALLHSLMREACAAESPNPPEATRDVQAVHEDPEDMEVRDLKIVRAVPGWWGDA